MPTICAHSRQPEFSIHRKPITEHCHPERSAHFASRSGPRDEGSAFDYRKSRRHHPGKRTPPRIPHARTPDRHGRLRPRRGRPLQLRLRSHASRIPPLRPRPPLDRLPLRRLAHAESVLRARTNQRNPRRPPHGPRLELCDPTRENSRQLHLHVASRTPARSSFRRPVQRLPCRNCRPLSPCPGARHPWTHGDRHSLLRHLRPRPHARAATPAAVAPDPHAAPDRRGRIHRSSLRRAADD